MSEQARVQRRKQRTKRSENDVEEIQPAAHDTRHEDIEKKLSEIDAAFDEYLVATSQPAADSVVVSEQQTHQVVKPLSAEEFVRAFRQTSGE